MRAIIAAYLAVLAVDAGAEQFCATTSSELAAHLETAEANGQADTIRLQTGTFVGNFFYNSGEDLTIEGGFRTFFDNPCSTVLMGGPSTTVLNGNNLDTTFHVVLDGDTVFTVRNLTITRGLAPSGRAGGMQIFFGDEVLIERVVFTDNEAQINSAFSVASANTIRVRNSVFALNHAVLRQTVSLSTPDTPNSKGSSDDGVYFIHNTVVDNSTGGGQFAGVYIFLRGTTSALVANSVFYRITSTDLVFVGPGTGTRFIRNNSFEEIPLDADVATGNVETPPIFTSDDPLDYDLHPTSTLIDAGYQSPRFLPFPLPFEHRFQHGAEDVAGRDRLRGPRYDIGAYESLAEVMFMHGFEGG